MSMVGSDAIGEQSDPVLEESQSKPPPILGPVQTDLKKEPPVVTAVRHVIDITRQDVAIGSGHRATSSLRVCSTLKRRIKAVFAF